MINPDEFRPVHPDVIGDIRDNPDDLPGDVRAWLPGKETLVIETTQPATSPATATYEEDGWVAEVAILRDLCDDVTEAYLLEVVRTITPPARFRPVPDGTHFHCERRRRYAGMIFSLTKHTEGGAA